MAFINAYGGGGIPAALKNGMNSVLNKKFGTSGVVYDPDTWPDDVNLLGALEIKNANGAIASFDDGADDVPISDGLFNFSPVQNLNGYSSAWAPGVGASPWSEQWESGVWTQTGQKQNEPSCIRCTDFIPAKPSTTYYAYYDTSAYPSGIIVRLMDSSYIVTRTVTIKTSVTETFTTTASEVFFVWCSYSVDNVTSYSNNVSFNNPATITTYQPYSNVCPITGHSNMTIYQAGKNLFDKHHTTENHKYLDKDGNVVQSSWWYISDYIPIKAGLSYAVRGVANYIDPAICFYDASKVFISGVKYAGIIPKIVTAPENACFCRFSFYTDDFDTAGLNYPSSNTSYEEYVEKTPVVVSFGLTAYGGYYDSVSGRLVGTHQFVRINKGDYGNEQAGSAGVPFRQASLTTVGVPKSRVDWNLARSTQKIDRAKIANPYTESAYGSCIGVVYATAQMDYPSFRISSTVYDTLGANDYVEYCYELETPVLLATLSTNEFRSILGNNNIYNNAGNTSIDYRSAGTIQNYPSGEGVTF